MTHILLHWIGTHFGDFDTGEEAMTRFLDQFEEYHKEEVRELAAILCGFAIIVSSGVLCNSKQ